MKNNIDYMEALQAGKEIVVVAPETEKEFFSAIYYMKNGRLYCFSREIELFERNDIDKVIGGIIGLEQSGMMIFVRG